MNVWGGIVKAVLGDGVANNLIAYLGKKRELKQQAELRKAELADAVHARQKELIQQGLAADATWELESLKAHADGWKDEAVLIVLLIPLVMVFIPTTAPFILTGFSILNQTPSWYRWLILMIFSAIYGIRVWRRQQYDTP